MLSVRPLEGYLAIRRAPHRTPEHPLIRPMLRSSSVLRAGLLLALILGTAAPARPQSGGSAPDEVWRTRAWMGDVTFLSLNALVGGLTAGILQTLRDGSFQSGFARGALGGAVSYGGRRLAVEEFSGAGLLGRQVSAVGVSVVRNASEGVPSLSRISLPAGPLILVVTRGERLDVRAEIDVNGAVWLSSALLDDRLVLDARATISAGAPVFRTPDHRLGSDGDHPAGMLIGGLVVLGHGTGNMRGHDVLAHERVHVLQYDLVQEIWGDPLETWISNRLGTPEVLRFIRPGVAYPLLHASIVSLLDIEWKDRIWEIEAEYLSHR